MFSYYLCEFRYLLKPHMYTDMKMVEAQFRIRKIKPKNVTWPRAYQEIKGHIHLCQKHRQVKL